MDLLDSVDEYSPSLPLPPNPFLKKLLPLRNAYLACG